MTRCKIHHDWSEWQYEEEGKCWGKKVCNRPGCDGTKDRREVHQWGDWKFISEVDCAQIRVCQRCEEVERRIKHDFTNRSYLESDSCKKHIICNRCSIPQSYFLSTFIESLLPEEHTWGLWEYQSEILCQQKRECTRCYSSEYRVEHTWGEWKDMSQTPCVQVRTCLICKSEDRRKQHEWGEWEYITADLCTQKHRCKRCGKENDATERLMHKPSPWKFIDQDSCEQVEFCSRCGNQIVQLIVVEIRTAVDDNRVDLKNLIYKHFTLSDLKELSFDLNVPYEDLAEGNKPDKVTSLISYFEKQGETLSLVKKCFEERPKIKGSRRDIYEEQIQGRASFEDSS